MAGRAFHCSARPGSDREAVAYRSQSRGHRDGTGSPEVSTTTVSTTAVSTCEVGTTAVSAAEVVTYSSTLTPALLQQHGEPLATAVLLFDALLFDALLFDALLFDALLFDALLFDALFDCTVV
jgi:hypothetical protein